MTAKKDSHNHNHRHHNLVLAISAVALFSSLWFFAKSLAKASPEFNSGRQLNASQCDTTGAPVINVTDKIVKTVDSGEGGNYWAFDDINRNIQVWKNSDNTYCVLVQNEGKFDAQAGQKSPGNTGILTGNEDGSFKGGYRAKITGVLLASTNWKTRGSLGTHEYNCDISGSCPGYINWVDQYFGPGYIFTYEWWGWTYQYKNNAWINSSEGNSGDIL